MRQSKYDQLITDETVKPITPTSSIITTIDSYNKPTWNDVREYNGMNQQETNNKAMKYIIMINKRLRE